MNNVKKYNFILELDEDATDGHFHHIGVQLRLKEAKSKTRENEAKKAEFWLIF